MKTYRNMKQLERDLKISSLERDIAYEELKALGEEYKTIFTPAHWVQTGLSLASKYGVFMLFKKIIK
ncbi:hypothetical protein F6U93_09175 [Tamlana haliotis]|uniref:Uncharacterized protein n=1 Tax=Pseudotamlana haliotis TaxID=2614804 RepID=A0A6N6MG46_9FLAO|nr:hypothetical protein [Tamlana haliotis]KAB1067765.1 hypothetical protein F6U93_09175 [Tamlana haliotis]